MYRKIAVLLACTLIARINFASELPQAFRKQSAARVSAMCAACMTFSAATMAHSKKASDKEIDMAVLLYRVWFDRAERQGANETDSRWALNKLKTQSDKVTLGQINYCISAGYKHFEALSPPKQDALLAEIEDERARLLDR